MGVDHTFDYHGNDRRGTARINFLSEPPVAQVPATAKQLDVLQAPYNITSSGTQYVCSYHEMPADKKYHVIVAEPILKHRLVHHMIYFHVLLLVIHPFLLLSVVV